MINNFALIIGAMKCGTTSIFNCLTQHPEIAGCKYKEPDFFSKAENFSKGFDYYQNLWNWNGKQHKYALEATPEYTKITHKEIANAAENIAQVKSEFGADFRFIYIMRDPLKRIESHYLHNALKGNATNAINLDREPKIKQTIIDASKYALQLDEYYQRFDSSKILLIDFTEFISNPQLTLERICRFLQIDDSFQFSQTKAIHNSSKRLRLKNPFLNKLRRTNTSKYLRSLVPEERKATLKNIFGFQEKASFKLPETLRIEIVEELQSDMERLQVEYDFVVSSWNIKLPD